MFTSKFRKVVLAAAVTASLVPAGASAFAFFPVLLTGGTLGFLGGGLATASSPTVEKAFAPDSTSASKATSLSDGDLLFTTSPRTGVNAADFAGACNKVGGRFSQVALKGHLAILDCAAEDGGEFYAAGEGAGGGDVRIRVSGSVTPGLLQEAFAGSAFIAQGEGSSSGCSKAGSNEDFFGKNTDVSIFLMGDTTRLFCGAGASTRKVGSTK
jgi:hypothetical protein